MIFTVVSGFRDISIDCKSLIVFDIDDTVLEYQNIDHAWWKNISDGFYQEHQDREKADFQAYQIWLDKISRTMPIHTDESGLNDIFERAKQKDCKIIFLTARRSTSHDITLSHLKLLNIEHDEIYYSNLIENKGQILNEIIETKYQDYDDYIFIDDVPSNLEKVKIHVGKEIRCYQFLSSSKQQR